jgi:two-component system, chemotaxis family, protein-glutamate methylesterase/glutaminase
MEKRILAVIGSSGAGLPIITSIFHGMPRLKGPVVLVQHMPVYINKSVRDNLAGRTEMTVKIADQDDPLLPGFLYLAPSELHLTFSKNERVRLTGGEKVNYVCPSIDVAMKSLTQSPPVAPLGILLSGVGDDGIEGIRHIKRLGGVTVALKKNATTITGMAEDAAATGDVDFMMDPASIRNLLIAHLGA